MALVHGQRYREVVSMTPEEDAKTARLNVRVEPQIKRRIEAVARHRGVTAASLIRPKIMDLHRELENHPATTRDESAA